MKLILQATLLGAALLTAGVQAAGDPGANQRLWTAAFTGDLAGVQKELPPTGNADVNAKDVQNRTALMYAAQIGDLGVVNALIKAGANVNAKANGGWTALMAAASNGRLGVVNALIEAGADVNAKKDISGRTPLMLAQQHKHADIVNALKAAGAK